MMTMMVMVMMTMVINPKNCKKAFYGIL